jgi:hypothetical protein
MGLCLAQLGTSPERGAGISCFCFFFSPPTLLGCLCQNHVSIAISKINHARPFFSSSLFFFAHIVHHGWRRGRTGGRAMAPLYGPGVGVWHGTGRVGTGQDREIDSVLRSLALST